MITKAAANLNGITIAYAIGLVNIALALIVSFGVHLTQEQRGYLVAFINGALVLVVHISHRVGEATNSGATTAKSQASMQATEPQPEQTG